MKNEITVSPAVTLCECEELQNAVTGDGNVRRSTVAAWREFNLPKLLLERGEDLEREGLEDTPRRVQKAWEEMLSGYTIDPDLLLQSKFTSEGEGLQVCKNISFTSMCEHHLLPFYGTVDIAYHPGEYVLGLSKMARLVDCYSKRLQIQERLVQEVASAMDAELSPVGLLVIAHATHFCCKGRGIKKDGMTFTTCASRGVVDQQLYMLLK